MLSMGLEGERQFEINVESNYGGGSGGHLQKFKLYETRSNFYMVGWDKNRTCWKILKINRLEQQSELTITEDATTYSEIECCDLLKRIHEGNKATGGLKFVTICYGIVGFIKFLGPHYMVLITKRKKIGTICGHAVYSIAKSEMIPISNSTMHSNVGHSRNENRYKKLMRAVDLTKDFYFSYSYNVMRSLQKNLSNHESGLSLYETMFVWNEFLTRGIRSQLKNSIWTVALVYGFFKQVKLSISGHNFNLILLARRSRHYAGTRYLKRGVNEKGRVANDVETEQILLEDVPEGSPIQMSSVVQIRGSIPLFWSQETSRLNIKPDIILSKKDDKYGATKLHFANLEKRYGNPIIILNLIKAHEKKPRESVLRAEFSNAIEAINKDLTDQNRLKFLHWDLSKYSRNKATNVLAYLVKVASNALGLTGIFHCQVHPSSSRLPCSRNCNGDFTDEDLSNMMEDANYLTANCINGSNVNGHKFVKPPAFQKGVLRTNCIDCLDRTNVAQYACGLVALAHQLHVFGYIDSPSLDLDSPLADDLMEIYEAMGDTLALQYGGSAAHNKIFSERRGQWKAATQSQEFFRTLQRYYSNAYMDAEKQDAINVFLGHFQPQQGKPALWELDSDQHYNVGRRGSDFVDEHARSIIKRSLSDGSILCDSNLNIDASKVLPMENSRRLLPAENQEYNADLSESPSVNSNGGSERSYPRYTYTPSKLGRQLFPDSQLEPYFGIDSTCFVERGDSDNCSNFLDVDWLSSSGNSCEEEAYERSMIIASPPCGEISAESRPASQSRFGPKGKGQSNGDLCDVSGSCSSSSDPLTGFSERFVNWVNYGDIFFP